MAFCGGILALVVMLITYFLTGSEISAIILGIFWIALVQKED